VAVIWASEDHLRDLHDPFVNEVEEIRARRWFPRGCKRCRGPGLRRNESKHHSRGSEPTS
jgi:hypothetical protein